MIRFTILIAIVGFLISNISCDTETPITPDPNLKSISISEGMEIWNSPKIALEIENDKNLSKIEFFVGNDLVGTINEKPYEFILNTRNYEDGPITIKVKVIDNKGEELLSIIRNARINNNLLSIRFKKGLYSYSKAQRFFYFATSLTNEPIGYVEVLDGQISKLDRPENFNDTTFNLNVLYSRDLTESYYIDTYTSVSPGTIDYENFVADQVKLHSFYLTINDIPEGTSISVITTLNTFFFSYDQIKSGFIRNRISSNNNEDVLIKFQNMDDEKYLVIEEIGSSDDFVVSALSAKSDFQEKKISFSDQMELVNLEIFNIQKDNSVSKIYGLTNNRIPLKRDDGIVSPFNIKIPPLDADLGNSRSISATFYPLLDSAKTYTFFQNSTIPNEIGYYDADITDVIITDVNTVDFKVLGEYDIYQVAFGGLIESSSNSFKQIGWTYIGHEPSQKVAFPNMPMELKEMYPYISAENFDFNEPLISAISIIDIEGIDSYDEFLDYYLGKIDNSPIIGTKQKRLYHTPKLNSTSPNSREIYSTLNIQYAGNIWERKGHFIEPE
jgi:hypothetical protein